MRGARLPVAMAMSMLLAACASSNHVHTSRADPLGSAPTASTEPTGTTGPSDTSTGGSQPVATSKLDWGPCDDPNAQDPALQCAKLKVPLDYDDPSGDSVDLALIKVPAQGDRTGAVLFNPGGPGASGFDYVAFGGQGTASTLGLDSLDLIGFDPRGVDRSNGIRCVSDQFEDQHLFADDTPDTPEEQALKDEANNGFIDGCKAKYGDTLRLYSTVNTAKDMDGIRAALGDDKISYYGGSYGTYLGATYASMFPDRVRAMVLDSAVEPNGDTAEQQFETQPVAFEDVFNHWAAWCEGDATCDFTGADVPGRWDQLKQKLDDQPLVGADGRSANNTTLQVATQAALYSESDWAALGQALANAAKGDPAGLFAIADSYNGRDETGKYSTLMQSFPVIECASGLDNTPADDPEALAADLRAKAPRMAGGVQGADLVAETDQCTKLVGAVKPGPISYSGDGPIVVVGGTNDPATPIRWAHKMVGELGPNARMVTYTGEGHGQLLANNCLSDIAAGLLNDLKLPDPDTECATDPVVPKPAWWDALPVPDGFSEVVAMPAVSAALGATPTDVFSELRTTTLSAKDAIDAYTDAIQRTGFQKFDAPLAIPIDDVAQGVYADQSSGAVLAVIAFGPKSFDDEALQSAKVDVPPDTTVVWLFQVQP
ncbi:MAG TPA: alpha/beta fold hydrolase [Ilumatobacteraceae bacterium]|nr:alpha/beta fold hydrolase [Ilumatobacteraceae bacterium]